MVPDTITDPVSRSRRGTGRGHPTSDEACDNDHNETIILHEQAVEFKA